MPWICVHFATAVQRMNLQRCTRQEYGDGQRAFSGKRTRTLIAAAIDGFGVALAPEIAVKSEISAGRLVRLLRKDEPPERPMHILFTARRATPKLRAFIDQVVAEYGA